MSLLRRERRAPSVAPDPLAESARRPEPRRIELTQVLSPSRIGAIYVLVLVVVVFGLWVPETFLTFETVRAIANDQAITGLIALSLVVPLATGVYDLSVGFVVGLAAILVAWLLAHTGMSPWAAIGITLVAGVAVGAINAVVVVGLKIDSFIATLATGSLFQAAIIALSGNVEITKRVSELSNIVERGVDRFTIPVFFTLLTAAVLWFVLERTQSGRYMHATGYSPEAARLAGIRTGRLRFVGLLTSGFLASCAGILLTGRIGAGSPSIGPPYLLPAFAAVFLGATQLKPGRFTSWGTLIAVLLLGTVTVGLSLASVPAWVPFSFNGIALIAAVGLARTRRTQ